MHDRIPPLRNEVCWDGVTATVAVSGELDLTTAPGLAERLLKVAAAHPKRLVLDLGGLMFVDVADARVLDCVHKALEAECPVIVRSPRPRPDRSMPGSKEDGTTSTRAAGSPAARAAADVHK